MKAISVKKSDYKTSRKYKCPYCNEKGTRNDLIDHVLNQHEDMIPEGYSAARVVYDFINGKNYGICMICHDPVYEWNSKINRYYNLCKKPECRARVREIALERHMKTYGKETLLNDPEHQEKMLSHRKISGIYTFSNGEKVTYTGSYERKAIEFFDKILEVPAKDLQIPGPVIEYEFKGKKHFYISDIYYIPGNLLIEVKDGGSNPNNREMSEYREKQLAKEEMFTSMGVFNYVRLTNNDFSQLLDIFAEMKNEAISYPNPKLVFKINEEVGGLPRHGAPEAYIIPYGTNNVFDGFAFASSDISDKIIRIDDDGNLDVYTEELFYSKFDTSHILIYKESDIKEKLNIILKDITSGRRKYDKNYFLETLVGRKMLHPQKDIMYTECFKYMDPNREKTVCKLIENGVMMNAIDPVFDDTNVVDTVEYVKICHSPKGYYAATPTDFYMATEYFTDIESLKASDLIKVMNDVYKTNHGWR